MPNRNVLIVDDYRDVRFMLKVLLEMKGCAVMEATNGQEAVNIVARKCDDIDLILMDLRMPLMDGVEATRRIRAQGASCNIPIVAISAHCEDDWESEATVAGAVECVKKPIDLEVLSHLLDKYCPS